MLSPADSNEGKKKFFMTLPAAERPRSLSLGPMLKPPLSPKSTHRRRRHSSAESDDSVNVSVAETISDHSDMEIRISALQVTREY
jgi:hypothetical protein